MVCYFWFADIAMDAVLIFSNHTNLQKEVQTLLHQKTPWKIFLILILIYLKRNIELDDRD